MDWKKFWAPMRQEMRKDQIWPAIIASFGIFPINHFAKEIPSIWVSWGVLLIWFGIVYFFYLVYLYFKK